ncbi:hypothetical protein DFH06DRAFT_1148258 [Mycena polygramma]|nr:hypothetical protein DFH06DRAFT_1148258 [Mycena polygramma]
MTPLSSPIPEVDPYMDWMQGLPSLPLNVDGDAKTDVDVGMVASNNAEHTQETCRTPLKYSGDDQKPWETDIEHLAMGRKSAARPPDPSYPMGRAQPQLDRVIYGRKQTLLKAFSELSNQSPKSALRVPDPSYPMRLCLGFFRWVPLENSICQVNRLTLGVLPGTWFKPDSNRTSADCARRRVLTSTTEPVRIPRYWMYEAPSQALQF